MTEQKEDQEKGEEVNMQCRRRTGQARDLNPCGSKTAYVQEIQNNVFRYECSECGAVWNISHGSGLNNL